MALTRTTFVDDSNETRLSGFLVPPVGASAGDVPQATGTDGVPAQWAPSGGSVPSGAGLPLGTVTPSGIGALYVDSTNGGLWIAVGATDADWLILGGSDGNAGSPGVSWATPTKNISVSAGAGGQAALTGADHFDGVYYDDTADSTQVFGVSIQVPGVIFPTSDPHIAGAWWDDAGTLTKSSG